MRSFQQFAPRTTSRRQIDQTGRRDLGWERVSAGSMLQARIDQETMIFIVVLVVGIFDRGYVLEEFSFLFWGASEACRLARSSQ